METEKAEISVDRISQLPKVILHHILYFLLQEDAVKTSLLSKDWRYVWCTRPNISFERNEIPVMEKILQVYHDKKLCIEEFHLWIHTSYGSKEVCFLRYWIPIILRTGMKKFHLYNSSKYWPHDLRGVLVEAASLQDLCLRTCELDLTEAPRKNIVAFKHLKKLRLKEVHIEEETFQSIISSCPLIEIVGIKNCWKLKTININKLQYLKDFDFVNYDGYETTYTIIFRVTNLETISINDSANESRHIKKESTFPVKIVGLYSRSFPNLKKVTLDEMELSNKSFDSFSTNFPKLEEFTVKGCYGFDELKLWSKSINQFVLTGTDYKSIKIDIDAPKMEYFKFHGPLPQSISLTTASIKCESEISVRFLEGFVDASTWFLKLNELLKGISLSQISLSIDRIQNLQGPLVLDNCCKPGVVEELCLLEGNTFRVPGFINGLFRVCHPRNISHYHWYGDEIIESLLRILFKRKECRRNKRFRQLWKQDLEDATVENFDTSREEWQPYRETTLVQSALTTNQYAHEFRFRLKWR